MKPTMRVRLLLTLCVAMAAGGCATSSQTVTTKTVMIAVPEVRDTLVISTGIRERLSAADIRGATMSTDTSRFCGTIVYPDSIRPTLIDSASIITASKVINGDTVAKATVDLKRRQVYLSVKPDSVHYQEVDTTHTTVQPVQTIHKPTIGQKFGIGFMAIGIFVVAVLLLVAVLKIGLPKIPGISSIVDSIFKKG